MTKKVIFKSKGSHLLISLSPSLRLCCSLNNVICRGMWVSGALLSSGESNHTPFTHTHFNHPLSRVSFLHLPRRLTRCVTSCIFHKVWAAWSIFHICYWQASGSQLLRSGISQSSPVLSCLTLPLPRLPAPFISLWSVIKLALSADDKRSVIPRLLG